MCAAQFLRQHARRAAFGAAAAALSGSALLLSGSGTDGGGKQSFFTSSILGTAASEAPPTRKERILVLGSGWGAVALLKTIDPNLYDVSVVSPRNYFLNTPLLPGVTVGTVEARSLIEPVRRLLPGAPGQAEFFEAAAVSVDTASRTVTCRDVSGITAANPEFTVPYDRLVVAVGAPCNTFGTPGVYEHATFLKEVEDALSIRRKLADLLETASLPGVSDAEARRMLSVLVVGGGPTGVEFAAELHDFLKDDMPRLYPKLGDKLSITVVQSADHILNTYDARISQYAEKKFARDGINVLTNRRVMEVRAGEAAVMDKKTETKQTIHFGVCVWSTGLGTYPFVKSLQAALGQPARRALAVDKCLRVRGVQDGSVYALGDCADIKSKAAAGAELLDHAKELFKQADTDGSGSVDAAELSTIIARLHTTYPQLQALTGGRSSGHGESKLQGIVDKFDHDKSGALSEHEFATALAQADAMLSSHPATAQVANQQGEYLGKQLNAAANAAKKTANANAAAKTAAVFEPEPFKYVHMGSFAALGSEQASLELPGDYVMSGVGTMMLWYGVYFSNQVSWRNKFLVVGDWFKKSVWGRDSSRV